MRLRSAGRTSAASAPGWATLGWRAWRRARSPPPPLAHAATWRQVGRAGRGGALRVVWCGAGWCGVGGCGVVRVLGGQGGCRRTARGRERKRAQRAGAPRRVRRHQRPLQPCPHTSAPCPAPHPAELMTDGLLTPAADVWSFGVICWEMYKWVGVGACLGEGGGQLAAGWRRESCGGTGGWPGDVYVCSGSLLPRLPACLPACPPARASGMLASQAAPLRLTAALAPAPGPPRLSAAACAPTSATACRTSSSW